MRSIAVRDVRRDGIKLQVLTQPRDLAPLEEEWPRTDEPCPLPVTEEPHAPLLAAPHNQEQLQQQLRAAENHIERKNVAQKQPQKSARPSRSSKGAAAVNPKEDLRNYFPVTKGDSISVLRRPNVM